MGKLLLRGTETEPERFVDGVHTPIISEELFYNVQLTMQGRNKKLNKQCTFRDREELPLRGILSCSNCGKHVTGSASRSRNGSKHFYYHCLHCKKERFRADTVNKEMEEFLNSVQITKEVVELYKVMVEEDVKGNPKQQAQQYSVLANELSKLETRKEELKNSCIDGQLSVQDFTELKQKLDQRIMEIKGQISEKKEEKDNFKEEKRKYLLLLPNLLEWYRNSDVQKKKEFIGSIFPCRFTFENNEVRTAKINSIVGLILTEIKELLKTKTGQNKYYTYLSRLVVPPGLEPGTT